MSDETALSNVEHTASSGTTRLTTDEVPFASELESVIPSAHLRPTSLSFVTVIGLAPAGTKNRKRKATPTSTASRPQLAKRLRAHDMALPPRRGVIESREAMLELPYALRQ